MLRFLIIGILILCRIGAETASSSVDPEAWLQKHLLQDLEGNSVSLHTSLEQERSLVLVFWTPWCGICAKEAPELVKAAATYRDRATFVGIVPGSDTSIKQTRVKSFITKHNINYLTLRDRKLEVTKALKVQGTPTIVIIDPSMQIRYYGHTPPESWTDVLTLP